MTKAQLRAKLLQDTTSIIGEHVHGYFRKFSDWDKSSEFWNSIREMPDDEWHSACHFAAGVAVDHILKVLNNEGKK